MSATEKPEIGTITWTDLTVPDAEAVRDFYSKVVGWKFAPVEMGGYKDFNMLTLESGKIAAGICHARGVNAALPALWMVYINVKDVDESAARCVELGGKMIVAPKDMGDMGRYCVMQDPAGAVAALFAPK